MTSLNPVALTIAAEQNRREACARNEAVTSRQGDWPRTIEMLQLGPDPECRGRVHDYPHQFLGAAMRQARS